jgi:hypothetical protein
MVGELDAGKPHVQFDEGALETYDSATRLCPTLPGCSLSGLPRLTLPKAPKGDSHADPVDNPSVGKPSARY